MSRVLHPRATAAIAVAIAVAAAAIVTACGDEEAPQPVASPAPCEPDARDLNPDDDPVEPSRGEPLIDAERGHAPVGFNDYSHGNGWITVERAFELHRAAGMSLTRLPLDWGRVERTPGELDFSVYDRIYCAALAADVRPVWSVTGIPGWAAPGGICRDPCVHPPAPEHLGGLARFAEHAAIRYPRSAAFEAWNEPNLSMFWGYQPPSASAYLAVLEATYDGVKNGNPDMPVLGGALSNNPSDQPDGKNLSLRTFLAGMLAGGAADHMDGFGLHPYPIAELGSARDQFAPALAASRELLATYAPGTRIWVTEIGVPTQGGSFADAATPAGQATTLAQAYDALDTAADVDAVLFHALMDAAPGHPNPPGFGFFSQPDAAGAVTAKPVVCEIRERTDHPGPCPTVIR